MLKAGWEVSLSDIVPSFLIVFAMQQSRGCWSFLRSGVSLFIIVHKQ